MNYADRVTNDEITELEENQIFVFGSNLSGIHGGGAAKLALDKFGAEWGNAYAFQGNTYAIPTKSEGIKRTLTVDEIQPYVDLFLSDARKYDGTTFLVTEIGCGLAGHRHEDIAPLFKDAVRFNNVHLPLKFWEVLLK